MRKIVHLQQNMAIVERHTDTHTDTEMPAGWSGCQRDGNRQGASLCRDWHNFDNFCQRRFGTAGESSGHFQSQVPPRPWAKQLSWARSIKRRGGIFHNTDQGHSLAAAAAAASSCQIKHSCTSLCRQRMVRSAAAKLARFWNGAMNFTNPSVIHHFPGGKSCRIYYTLYRFSFLQSRGWGCASL